MSCEMFKKTDMPQYWKKKVCLGFFFFALSMTSLPPTSPSLTVPECAGPLTSPGSLWCHAASGGSLGGTCPRTGGSPGSGGPSPAAAAAPTAPSAGESRNRHQQGKKTSLEELAVAKKDFYKLLCSHVYCGLLHRAPSVYRFWAKQSSHYTVI